MATIKKPYIVQTKEGIYCAEFDAEDQARASAERRNEEAKDLEITTRYEWKKR
jgi:hypothetical protein